MAHPAVPAIVRAAHSYLFYRSQEAEAKRQKELATSVAGDKKRNLLREYISENGTPNGKDLDWVFDEPLTIEGSTYDGLRLQAKERQLLDEDTARDLLASRGLTHRVRREVVTEEWDWDELYTLNQEGKISDDELDSLTHTDTQFALVVIK